MHEVLQPLPSGRAACLLGASLRWPWWASVPGTQPPSCRCWIWAPPCTQDSKAVKKLLTKKQIKKLEPKPKPGTLIYSHHAILRAAAPGNDGLPIIHVKPKPKPKKKAPHKKAPGSAVAPKHVSKVVPTKPTGSAKKAARKAIEKKATSMMPKAIAKAFAKAEKKQVKKEEAKKKPKVEKAKPKPFVFSDAKERAAKWAAKKEGTIVSKDHA